MDLVKFRGTTVGRRRSVMGSDQILKPQQKELRQNGG